jgi:RNA polymerase sigma-70 factor (ECF subfamily)
MVARDDPDTEELVDRARAGDREAREQLLGRHRKRLRQMVALRMDRRLLARVDPSDVVQEALTDAAQELSDYLRTRPVPFYPWLRQLAWERLIELHRRHLHSQKRSVRREDVDFLALPDESAVQLAQRLLAPGSSPSERVLRDELRGRVQAALAQLSPRDREVLVLRHLEQLSTKETAAVLGITPGAVKVRHLRALERLRGLLGEDLAEEGS